jgi:hypothetical protein
MLWPESSREAAMRPRMFHPIVRIFTSAVVSDPFIASRVDVRPFGMSLSVRRVRGLGRPRSRRSSRGWRTVGGDMSTSELGMATAVWLPLAAFILCKGNCAKKNEQSCELRHTTHRARSCPNLWLPIRTNPNRISLFSIQ